MFDLNVILPWFVLRLLCANKLANLEIIHK